MDDFKDLEKWLRYFFQLVEKNLLSIKLNESTPMGDFVFATTEETLKDVRDFKKKFMRLNVHGKPISYIYMELLLIIKDKERQLLDRIQTEKKKSKPGPIKWPLRLRIEMLRALVLCEHNKEKQEWFRSVFRKNGRLEQLWLAKYPKLPFPRKLPDVRGNPMYPNRWPNHLKENLLNSIFDEERDWKHEKILPETSGKALLARLRNESIPETRKMKPSYEKGMRRFYKAMLEQNRSKKP